MEHSSRVRLWFTHKAMTTKPLFASLLCVCLLVAGCDGQATNKSSLRCDQIVDRRISSLDFSSLAEEELRHLTADQFGGAELKSLAVGRSWSWIEGDRYFNAGLANGGNFISTHFDSRPTIDQLFSCVGQPDWYETRRVPNTLVIVLLYPRLGIAAFADLSNAVGWFDIALGRRLEGRDVLREIVMTNPGSTDNLRRTLWGVYSADFNVLPWPKTMADLPEISKWPQP